MRCEITDVFSCKKVVLGWIIVFQTKLCSTCYLCKMLLFQRIIYRVTFFLVNKRFSYIFQVQNKRKPATICASVHCADESTLQVTIEQKVYIKDAIALDYLHFQSKIVSQ